MIHKNVPLAQQVLNNIIAGIESGELVRENGQLPSEGELGKLFEVSRATVREAQQLATKTIRADALAVAAAEFVAAIYNPRSRQRTKQLTEAAAIFRRHRPGRTPVAIATAVGTGEERVVLSDLDHFLDEAIDMRSIVLIGNRSSQRLGDWLVTPRGYPV